MKETILIIGATGSVGLEIAKRLSESNKNVKIAVRDPARAKRVKLGNTDLVKFDYYDESSFNSAIKDIKKLVLVSPPSHLNLLDQVKKVINIAVDNGVELIVNISALSAETEQEKPMKEIEDYIKSSNINYVILRPNCYMQNFKDLFKNLIIEEGQLTIPAGNNKVCFVDIRDVADCAIEALKNGNLVNNTYTLTGEQSINMHVVAYLFSEKLNKEVEYNDISEHEFESMLKYAGWPASSIEGTLQLCNHVKSGVTNVKSNDIKTILGRNPIKFEQFISDYSDVWA